MLLVGRCARTMAGVRRVAGIMMRVGIGSGLVVRHAGGACRVLAHGRARHPDARGDRMERQHEHQ